MLTWIELTNFQKHAFLLHEFSEGLNLVVGPNWSGKSSLMRAVRVALGGVAAGKVRAEGLAGPEGSSWAVKLGFSLRGHDYVIERTPRKALLTQVGVKEPLASGHTAVTAEVDHLIGSVASFMAYQVALQGEADTLLTLGAAKLAAHIESVIGSDVVDRVLERIRSQRSVLSAVNDAQTLEWSGRLLEAQAQHQEKLALAHAQYREIDELGQKMPALEALREAKRVELAGLMSEAMQAANIAKERARLAERLDAALADKAADEARLETIGPVDDPEAIQLELQQLAEQARSYEELSGKLAEAKGAASKAQETLDSLPKVTPRELDKATSDAGAAHGAVRALEMEIAVIAANIESHRQMLAGAACPTCKRAFEGHDPDLLAAELEAVRARHQALLLQKDDLEKLAYSFDYRKTELEEAEKSRSAWWAHWVEVEAASRSLETQLSALIPVEQELLDKVSERYRVASQRAADRDWVLRCVQAAEHSIAELQAQLAELPVPVETSKEILSELAEAVRKLDLEIQAASLQDAALRERYAGLTEVLTALGNEITHLQGKLEEAGKTKVRIALLDRLAKYLRANRDRFTEHAWNSVLEYAGGFARGASGGDIEALVRTQDGKFAFQEGGVVRDIELASGLQLSILGVGLKLALAAAVNSPFAVLLFDEVSAAASEDNALRMTQELAAAGSQILLVTHRDSDTAAANSVIQL